MARAHRQAAGRVLIRELLWPVVAAVVIVVTADVRIALGLPGHRGLVWLTLLVAVALTARRPETVIAVGATSTVATLLLHAAPGPWASARYLAAAILLNAVVSTAVTRRHRWLVALAAAPVHLVALIGPLSGLLGGVRLGALASTGIGEKALFHLGFGLIAGLLGWGVAVAADHVLPQDPG